MCLCLCSIRSLLLHFPMPILCILCPSQGYCPYQGKRSYVHFLSLFVQVDRQMKGLARRWSFGMSNRNRAEKKRGLFKCIVPLWSACSLLLHFPMPILCILPLPFTRKENKERDLYTLFLFYLCFVFVTFKTRPRHLVELCTLFFSLCPSG